MQTTARTLFSIVVALVSLGAITERVREPGVTDTEIRIGNVMPYSGSLEAFGAIGRAEAAYFELINERGGINGRKVRFISYDDKSDPSTALEVTRGLVEKDNVQLMPPGPDRTAALKKAGILRRTADLHRLAFAKRGRPRK